MRYPDLTYGLLGYRTLSSDSSELNPASFAASINSFNDGSNTHLSLGNLLPLFLGRVLLK